MPNAILYSRCDSFHSIVSQSSRAPARRRVVQSLTADGQCRLALRRNKRRDDPKTCWSADGSSLLMEGSREGVEAIKREVEVCSLEMYGLLPLGHSLVTTRHDSACSASVSSSNNSLWLVTGVQTSVCGKSNAWRASPVTSNSMAAERDRKLKSHKSAGRIPVHRHGLH